MSKLKRVLRCYHCGAILQADNPDLPGYISPEVLKNETPKIPYCNACYENMQSLNGGVLDLSIEDDVIKILKDAVATDAIIIWVVDLFSFNGAINPNIAKIIKNLKVSVIGNKRDLFSRTINDDTFIRFIKERFNKVGIKPTSIMILGNESTIDKMDLISRLNKLREGHDVYMIGSEQSGKTTIINRLLKTYKNKSKWSINSAIYPETSVKVLEIPFNNSSFFYELPGWPLTTSVVSKVEKELVKYIVPKKKFHAHGISLSEGESFLVGGLAAYTLVKGKGTAFKFYASEDVETKKVNSLKLQRVLEENYHTRSIRPVSDRFTSFSDYDCFEFEMDNDGQYHDISIEGLCWVSFIARGQIVRIMLPKGTSLVECLSKVR